MGRRDRKLYREEDVINVWFTVTVEDLLYWETFQAKGTIDGSGRRVYIVRTALKACTFKVELN